MVIGSSVLQQVNFRSMDGGPELRVALKFEVRRAVDAFEDALKDPRTDFAEIFCLDELYRNFTFFAMTNSGTRSGGGSISSRTLGCLQFAARHRWSAITVLRTGQGSRDDPCIWSHAAVHTHEARASCDACLTDRTG